MIECVTKIDGKLQKELIKVKFLTSLIMFIVGGVGSIVYVVLSSVFFDKRWPIYLIVFVVLLAVALFFLFSL